MGVAAVTCASLVIPAGASAQNLVDELLGDVREAVNGLLGGGQQAPPASPAPPPAPAPAPAQEVKAEPKPDAGTPPNYVPPAHGTTEHGQGTGATVDLTPSDELPLPYEEGGGSEEVVVGGSRGELHENGTYHGHVTILSLLGNELIQGADTGPGQSSAGPLGDVNALLNDVCTTSGICLNALAVNSQTTDTSSTNSFAVASAGVNLGGTQILDLGAVQSEGSISESDGCRTATGSSEVAGASILGISADVINSSSSSSACRDGQQTQTDTSSVIGLAGTGLPLPAPGCENGTPNTVLEIPLVLALVCNADNSSGAGGLQLQAPYGVREGLTVFGLTSLVKATTAASESRASAPPADDGGDDDGGGRDDGGRDDGGRNDGGRDGGDDDRDDGDRDGDGVPDADDACPSVPGPASNDGCPLGGGPTDTDGDGIPDGDDACPNVPGPASNDGCPLGGPSGEGPDRLAFTGADVLALALIGFGVGGSGLGLMALADRRRRTRLH